MNRLNALIILCLITTLLIAEDSFSSDAFTSSRSGYYSRRDSGALLPIEQSVMRPPSLQGLTGLMVTNSAYTLPAGQVAVGLAFTSEDNTDPKYSVQQVPLTFTMGIANNIEVGVKAKAIASKTGTAEREFGAGDSEILIKGRLNAGDDYFPAIAVGLGGMLPTGDKSKGLREVEDWGARAMVMVSQEAYVMGEFFVGAYLEGQAVFRDSFDGEKAGSDRHVEVNAGLLFLPTEDNNLQLILEYNRVGKKNIVTLHEGRSAAISPAVRYATKSYSVTLGAQFIDKRSGEPEDSIKYIAELSVGF